jgi:predicted phosphodiesterase
VSSALATTVGRVRREPVRYLLVVLVALVSAGVAMWAWGAAPRDIGPVEARLKVVPSYNGGTNVEVPPLGDLTMSTHVGPLQVRATVTGIEARRARALLSVENPGRTLTEQIARDGQDALAAAAARAVLVGLVAAAVTSAVVFRRVRDVLVGTGAVAVALGLSSGLALGTVRTEALDEPRFDGLLAQAPALIGRVEDFDAYSQRIAELTANVARVYGSLAALPAPLSDDTTRVLWVSDIHNNPQAFVVMRQLAEQFDVAAVVDTGDIVDLGSAVENRLLTAIAAFDVPYVYVRGNHDSRAVTQTFIAQQPNGVVLDEGETVEIGDVVFAGTGHPLFRPNKRVVMDDGYDQQLRAAGEQLARAVAEAEEEVDVALVHEPAMAEPLFGAVPLLLQGHVHERRSRVAEGTLALSQGSSGGAGLRTLDRGEAEPLQMSVLHFSPDGDLLAVDDITIGGLGERSVTVDRKTPASYDVDGEATE